MIFVPAAYHLSTEQERAIYDQHRNHPEDAGYRAFLDRLRTPLIKALSEKHIAPPARGLDFGSGPGPTLSLMLEEAGYDMAIYDHFYARHPDILNQQYDFITSTEVWEHLSQPRIIIDQLFSILKPNGVIGVMTKRIPRSAFEDWHYIKDPTHISFFADETFAFLAERYQCQLKLITYDVALLIRD
jgi:SAM-dependent methyltransferase